MTAKPLPSRIAVLGAFRSEVERIRAALADAGGLEQAGSLRYETGRLGSRALLVGATGMGKVRAAAGVQAAIDRFEPGLLLFCGTAGGISDRVRALDLVVADQLLQHDALLAAPEWIEVDRSLVVGLLEASRAAVSAKPSSVHRGRLLTGDHPVLDREEGRALARKYRAVAVDMESASAAAVAASNALPLAVIKAVTDGADRAGAADFEKNFKRAASLAQEALLNYLLNL